MGNRAVRKLDGFRRICAMASWPNIYFFRKSTAAAAEQQRVIRFMVRGVAWGLLLGIVTRAAWDLGIIAAVALALRDLGVALRIMIRDASAACVDFIQFIFHQMHG